MNKKFIVFTLVVILVAVSFYFLSNNNAAGEKEGIEPVFVPTLVPAPPSKATYKKLPKTKPATTILASENTSVVESSAKEFQVNSTYQKFDEWLDRYNKNKTILVQGVSIAKQRKLFMQADMQNNPSRAWKNAISYHEYASLPVEIKAFVEEPFSTNANLTILPNEVSGKGNVVSIRYGEKDKRYTQQVTLYGNRKNILSKNKLVVQGARLGKLAVIADQSFQLLSGDDASWAKKELPLGNTDEAYDYYTNEKITGNPVLAVAGGKRYLFSSKSNVDKLNSDISLLENKIDPNSHRYQLEKTSIGSATVANSNTSRSLQSRLSKLVVEASVWTETNKKVFFIRVDFSDNTGESVSKGNLEAALNGPVSTLINEFSYGKTGLEGAISGSQVEASSQVVRLPQAGSYYKNLDDANFPDGSVQLHEDTITAFNALATGINLTDFDIVGVHFADIGMDYDGLASVGGGEHWLKATTATNVVVHEFGHNYGLGHANYWDAGGTSVVGAGNEIGYGDIYDTMGNTSSGDFHMQAKALLNWMPTTEWNDVTTSGLHKVYRFDQDILNTNTKGLRLTKGTNEYYWVGYRREFSANNVLQNGTYIIWQRPNASNSVLIDTTAGSAGGKEDAGISLGRTYSDSTANIHITPVKKGGSGTDEWLDIQVNIGAFSGNQNPLATITAPNVLTARTPLTFTATASDSDGDTLAYDWDFGDEVVHSNTSSVVQSWTVGGSYTINLTVSDMKGGTATQQLNVTVTDPATQWTDRTSNVANPIVDIATDDTTAVAITNFKVIASSDGVTWSTLAGRIAANSYTHSITYDGSQWIIVGQDHDGVGWRGVIYTSPDAITWTERYKAGNILRSIASSGSVLVAVGDNGEAVRSIDAGITWSPVASGASTGLAAVSYGNSKFIAVGNQYFVGDFAAITTSTDGLTWTNQTPSSGVAKDYGYISIAYLNDKFIGTGFNSFMGYLENNGGTEFITTRTDQEVARSLVYGNGVYFAAGVNTGKDENGDGFADDTDLISVDGKTWLAAPNTPSIPDRYAGVFFKNTVITVGDNGNIRQSGIIIAPLTDSDGDGFDDTLEVNVPNALNSDIGDGNGDGTQDNSQSDVSSLIASNSANWITFANTHSGAQSNFVTVAAPITTPTDNQLISGAVQYDLTTASGASVQIEVYVKQDTSIQDYLLLGNDGNWAVQNATVTHTGNKTKLVFSVTEGGKFDRDATANGILQLAQGGVMVKSGLDVWPYAYRFGSTELNTQTPSKTFTVKNTGSRILNITGVSKVGNTTTEFIITTDNCTGQTLAANASCTIDAALQPTSTGTKSAFLQISTNDPDNATVSIFLSNNEAIEQEAERRLPPVLNGLEIPENMTAGQTYTLNWSVLGYHDDYDTWAVFFDCAGIAENCGSSFGTNFEVSSRISPTVVEAGDWSYKGIQSKVFHYSYEFTPSTERFDESKPIVIRFYRKNGKDNFVGNSALSLIIPGNHSDIYYDSTGRRIQKTVNP